MFVPVAARDLGWCAGRDFINPFFETASPLLHHSFEFGVAERNYEELPVLVYMAPKRPFRETAIRHAKREWVRQGDLKFALETGVIGFATFFFMLGIVWMDGDAAKAEGPAAGYEQAEQSGFSHTNRTVLSKLVDGVSEWGQCQIVVPCAQEVDKATDGVPLYWEDSTDPRSVAAVK
ncbi:MAG: hypothetical protein ACXW35_09605 [Nitrospira sp.]